MYLNLNHLLVENKLSIALATQDRAPEIVNIINEAFWPSHKLFLSESNPLSQLRVSEEFVKTAISAEDKEFYILTNSVNSFIAGTILLQKNIEGEPEIAKFNLLAANRDYKLHNGLKVGDLLMTHIINRVEQLGKTKLKIEVVDSGEESNKLLTYYEDRGFIKTGRVMEFPRKHCLMQEYIDKVRLIELERSIVKPKL